jgi:hypothetical protein
MLLSVLLMLRPLAFRALVTLQSRVCFDSSTTVAMVGHTTFHIHVFRNFVASIVNGRMKAQYVFSPKPVTGSHDISYSILRNFVTATVNDRVVVMKAQYLGFLTETGDRLARHFIFMCYAFCHRYSE